MFDETLKVDSLMETCSVQKMHLLITNVFFWLIHSNVSSDVNLKKHLVFAFELFVWVKKSQDRTLTIVTISVRSSDGKEK